MKVTHQDFIEYLNRKLGYEIDVIKYFINILKSGDSCIDIIKSFKEEKEALKNKITIKKYFPLGK